LTSASVIETSSSALTWPLSSRRTRLSTVSTIRALRVAGRLDSPTLLGHGRARGLACLVQGELPSGCITLGLVRLPPAGVRLELSQAALLDLGGCHMFLLGTWGGGDCPAG
jgi:hypothetical protein